VPASASACPLKRPHGHIAVHGGCLNEIGGCENGHAEVKIDGTRLRMWLVGGGNNTTTAMRVPDASIALAITIGTGQPPRTLVLAAKPLILAEETIGALLLLRGERRLAGRGRRAEGHRVGAVQRQEGRSGDRMAAWLRSRP
jgi:hypothetical protein